MSDIIQQLEQFCLQMRLDSLLYVENVGSGHSTTSSSIVEILAALFFHPEVGFKTNFQEPRNPACDKVVLSKGHAAPSFYSAWAHLGLYSTEKLNGLRQFQNDFEGHPTPALNFVDVATGSLGQGLSAACGMAYSNRKDNLSSKIYCICGDGEMAEGSCWEAANWASKNNLTNLMCIVDVNNMGQSNYTMFSHNLEEYDKRFQAFGWQSFCVDGHDLQSIIAVLRYFQSGVQQKPVALICKTFKGRGYGENVEGKLGFHGRCMGKQFREIAEKLIRDQLKTPLPTPRVLPQFPLLPPRAPRTFVLPPGPFTVGQNQSCRPGYGKALIELGNQDTEKNFIYVLDADMKNSTFQEMFEEKFPDRFIECYIAEQNMVGVAVGLSAQGRSPFCATFTCFLTRAFDQIRMSAVSRSNIKFYGTHVGSAVGPDGPSQMGVEDLAMFCVIPNMVVLYPSDANATFRCVELAANHKGSVYIRGTKNNCRVVYSGEEVFQIGKSKILRENSKDVMSIITGGITLQYALDAADALAKENIFVKVVDIFSIKPLDVETLIQVASQGPILVVEDHYKENGIYAAVLCGLNGNCKARQIAVHDLPRGGHENDLMKYYNFVPEGIIKTVKEMLA